MKYLKKYSFYETISKDNLVYKVGDYIIFVDDFINMNDFLKCAYIKKIKLESYNEYTYITDIITSKKEIEEIFIRTEKIIKRKAKPEEIEEYKIIKLANKYNI